MAPKHDGKRQAQIDRTKLLTHASRNRFLMAPIARTLILGRPEVTRNERVRVERRCSELVDMGMLEARSLHPFGDQAGDQMYVVTDVGAEALRAIEIRGAWMSRPRASTEATFGYPNVPMHDLRSALRCAAHLAQYPELAQERPGDCGAIYEPELRLHQAYLEYRTKKYLEDNPRFEGVPALFRWPFRGRADGMVYMPPRSGRKPGFYLVYVETLQRKTDDEIRLIGEDISTANKGVALLPYQGHPNQLFPVVGAIVLAPAGIHGLAIIYKMQLLIREPFEVERYEPTEHELTARYTKGQLERVHRRQVTTMVHRAIDNADYAYEQDQRSWATAQLLEATGSLGVRDAFHVVDAFYRNPFFWRGWPFELVLKRSLVEHAFSHAAGCIYAPDWGLEELLTEVAEDGTEDPVESEHSEDAMNVFDGGLGLHYQHHFGGSFKQDLVTVASTNDSRKCGEHQSICLRSALLHPPFKSNPSSATTHLSPRPASQWRARRA